MSQLLQLYFTKNVNLVLVIFVHGISAINQIVSLLQIVHLRNDHEREHERKMIEMKEASQRLQEDCEHRIQLER